MKYRKKSEHWLWRHLQPRMWTMWNETLWTPTHRDRDPNWGQTGYPSRDLLEHEYVHMYQQERFTKVGFLVLYFGPLPFLFVPLLLLGYFASAWFLLAIPGLLPLSVGFAYGRWHLEREAYFDQALMQSSPLTYGLWAADALSSYKYGWAYPRKLARKWFRDHLTNK